MAIKILIGGSPCTHWSIAQKNNRETEPSGMGWELFKNYLIAKEKFKPDFFLYENNKSAAQAIKDQIAHELGVGKDPKVRFTYINSALVSAQNRQRFYVTNFGEIEQPEDRGILLKDILETGGDLTSKDKPYCLTASYDGACAWNTIERSQRNMVAEPVALNTTTGGKSQCLRASCYKDGIRNMVANRIDKRTCVAEPLAFSMTGTFGNRNASVSEKAITTVQKDNSVAEPVCMRYERSEKAKKLRKRYEAGKIHHGFHELSELHPRTDGKTNTLSTVLKDNPICEPVRVGCYPSPDGTLKNSQGMRLYSIEGKSVNITANGGGLGAKAGLYAIPVNTATSGKAHTIKAQYYKNSIANFIANNGFDATAIAENCNGCATPVEWDEQSRPTKAVSCADGKEYPVYEVRKGYITIKDKQYPIKLPEGFYIIRKLTVTECCRLQTMPDDYCKAVSATQGYKGLGNGWTAEVIIHLLNHALKDIPRNEEIVVLSLYDGIGTGRYCLEKMGFTHVKYYAYEIDKYPMAIANDNYPDIIQCGDAFAVREDSWKPPQTRSEWLDELLEVM